MSSENAIPDVLFSPWLSSLKGRPKVVLSVAVNGNSSHSYGVLLSIRGVNPLGTGGTCPPQSFGWGDTNGNVPPSPKVGGTSTKFLTLDQPFSFRYVAF